MKRISRPPFQSGSIEWMERRRQDKGENSKTTRKYSPSGVWGYQICGGYRHFGWDSLSQREKKSEETPELPTTDEQQAGPSSAPPYSFGNMAIRNRSNPLYHSVIYDSGCDSFLTHEKSRNTAYIPTSTVTLVSSTKMRDEGGCIWNMHTDHLVDRRSGERVCKIDIKFNLAILEYNPNPMTSHAFAVQPKSTQKVTPWTWHLRLGHCRPDVINQLRKIDEIKVEDGEAPKTVECETCSLSKMHKIIRREPTGRATRPFEILHFDLTITEKGDGISVS